MLRTYTKLIGALALLCLGLSAVRADEAARQDVGQASGKESVSAKQDPGGAATGTSGTTAAQKPEVSAGQHRPRVAVLDFTVTQVYGYDWWYGLRPLIQTSVSDMLTTELVNQNLEVVERSRIDEVLKEQDFGASGRVDQDTAAKIGKVLGADILIMGSVTEFGIKQEGINVGDIFHFHVGNIGRTTARVKLDVRMVNVQTSRIEGAASAIGKEANVNVDLNQGWWNRINFHSNEWWDSVLGKATRKAVVEVAKKMASKYDTLPLIQGPAVVVEAAKPHDPPTPKAAEAPREPLKVLKTLTPDEFIIDGGKAQGVSVGDRFEVVQVSGTIKNDNGEVAFETKRLLGVVEVVEVQEKGAKIKLIHRETDAPDIKEGDQVQAPTASTSSH